MALAGEMDTVKVEFQPRTTDNARVFKGIRMRKWGRWVSEIRVPRSRSRIWLGSYDTQEKAARAYDAALYCLQGAGGQFNFPADERPYIPEGLLSTLTKSDIKGIAQSFASPLPLLSSNCMSMSPVASSVSSSSSAPVGWSESQVLCYSGDNNVACESGHSLGLDEFLPENLLLGGPAMMDAYSLWDSM